MTNRKKNKKQDLETRLYNNTVNVALYLIYRLSKHASLSMREIELRCGTSSKSIRKTKKGVSPSLKTIHKNINCCLSEMNYDFILHKLARIISKVISEDKNLVFMVVDDDELEKYPESQIILKKKRKRRRRS